jgi:hypothetical protein
MTLMGLLYRRELDSTLVGRSNEVFVDGLPEAGQQRPGDGGMEESGGMKEHGQRTTRAICAGGAIRWMTMAGRNTGSRRGRPAWKKVPRQRWEEVGRGAWTAGRYKRQELGERVEGGVPSL